MASSISDNIYEAIEGAPVPVQNFTQKIRCVKCGKIVAHVSNGKVYQGPAICPDCFEKIDEKKP